MKDLHSEYKKSTGHMPIVEIDIEELEIIPDHYLIEKEDLKKFSMFDQWDNCISLHQSSYVEFLENKIDELKEQLNKQSIPSPL